MNYNVHIYSDNLDGFYANGEDSGTQTAGTLMLDGVEVSWSIGREKWHMTYSGGWDGFDLLINEGRDFRSRADACDIYEAVVDALQDRHHPDHCDCDECEERHAVQVHRVLEVLRKEGLSVTSARPTPATVRLKGLGL